MTTTKPGDYMCQYQFRFNLTALKGKMHAGPNDINLDKIVTPSFFL